MITNDTTHAGLRRDGAVAEQYPAIGRQQYRRSDSTDTFAAIIGESVAMLSLIEMMTRIINRKWRNMLIAGETGTGKELLARALHTRSFREFRPFVDLRCGEIPAPEIEPLLFGVQDRNGGQHQPGILEQAGNGTAYIDEIGKLDLAVQGKLLKAIEQKRFQRVNGEETILLNARIIATSSENLQLAMQQGRFLGALFYQLCVASLSVPPLRERNEDIAVLALHFLNRYAGDYQSPAREFTDEAMTLLAQYHWPGNIRELRFLVERLALLSDRRTITAGMVQEVLFDQPFPAEKSSKGAASIEIPTRGMSLQEGEKQLIQAVLKLNNWNKRRSSQILRISRPRLDRKTSKYGLQQNFNGQ